MELPIIDFSKCGINIKESDLKESNLKEAGSELYKAFQDTGFAYLKGAGVPNDQFNKLNEVTEKFYSKKTDYKDSFIHDVTFGYDKSFTTGSDSETSYLYMEGFHIAGSPFVDNTTPWPDIPHFEDSIKASAEICKQLSLRVLRALGLSMGLKDPNVLLNNHKKLNDKGNLTTLRSIYYPGVQSTQKIQPGQTRAGEHTDWGTFTLLFQDSVGGLQVKTRGGTFIDAKPIPDTIIVNIADTLSMLSNNDLKSTVHRVIIPSDPELRSRARRSLAYFVTPDDETILSKLEYVLPEKNSANDKSILKGKVMTAAEYINKRYKEDYPDLKNPTE